MRKTFSKAYCEQNAVEILTKAGVTQHPVHVERLAKSLGIKVRYFPLDEELSGMIFYKEGHVVVGVNARHHVNRQRFTIAHELGHFSLHNDILEQGAHVDKTITMLKRDGESSTGDVRIEVEANQFAAALLMPKDLITAYMDEVGLDYGSMPDEDAIQNTARAFKVSTTTIAFRLGNIFNL